MAEEEFVRAVKDGLKLAKRVYAGKDRQIAAAPWRAAGMARSADSFIPSAPMVYAVISDPAVVDNPDIPSYQPHVYGRCDPPALIPLHMGNIVLEVDCLLDSAFVSVSGQWRVHCVMRNKMCDCRLVVPMGEQGSVLGVEVEVGGRSYYTQVIEQRYRDTERTIENEGGGFLKQQIFYLIIPQVNGGSDLFIRAIWSQKLTYNGSQFLVRIPFNFPEYIIPFSKVVAKHEKIQLNLNSGFGKELLIQKISHPLKENGRQAGKLNFLYEADVEKWSNNNFEFSFGVYANRMSGGLLLKSPTTHDDDQRDMFCFYLFPGNDEKRKSFKKEIVFVVDVSGSMQGKLIENVKSALAASLLELHPVDLFDIIAFNDELYSFSQCLEHANEDRIESAIQWMDTKFIADGRTDIMHPLKEAIGLLSSTKNSLPQIFLITDGAVEDERNICHTIRTYLANSGSLSPRISTFGIGSYSNHYFLKMLACIGRGQYDAAYDADSIATRIQKWFNRASSTIVANLMVDISSDFDEFEVYSIEIPDLSAQCPLIISGRCYGKFTETIQAKGILADMTDIDIDLKVHYTKDFPLEKAMCKQQIDLLTAQAWFLESKHLVEKVTKLSIQNSTPSEYTCIVLLQNDNGKEAVKQVKKQKSPKHAGQGRFLPAVVRGGSIGFGDTKATLENRRLGEPETFAIFNKATGCCSTMAYCCCCPCCIKVCGKMNDHLAIAFTQLCSALSCLACSECCTEICCNGSD